MGGAYTPLAGTTKLYVPLERPIRTYRLDEMKRAFLFRSIYDRMGMVLPHAYVDDAPCSGLASIVLASSACVRQGGRHQKRAVFLKGRNHYLPSGFAFSRASSIRLPLLQYVS